jgi:hypothetical protein
MTKIFCIGFQKTGTTSLGEAFEKLGYKVCGVYHELLPDLVKGDFEKIKDVAEGYDVCKDNPWPVLYQRLDQFFPGSKFILTIRDEKAWIKSVVNHFDSKPSEMIRFIYGVSFPTGNEELFLNRYRKHNQDVIDYFKNRPGDLLIIDLEKEDAWKKLCALLQFPVPSFPFPHANKGAYTLPGKWWQYVWKRVRARWRDRRNNE